MKMSVRGCCFGFGRRCHDRSHHGPATNRSNLRLGRYGVFILCVWFLETKTYRLLRRHFIYLVATGEKADVRELKDEEGSVVPAIMLRSVYFLATLWVRWGWLLSGTGPFSPHACEYQYETLLARSDLTGEPSWLYQT